MINCNYLFLFCVSCTVIAIRPSINISRFLQICCCSILIKTSD
ncbi:Hypothetical protein ADU69_2113 (plasmid) [Pediococcus damnosus]|nr:Hypothetical protein ADU69_2113 [Pediococcus damnosus]